MKNRAIIVLIMALCACRTVGQARAEEAHDHTHHSHAHHGHDLSGFELALSAGYAHLQEEDETVPGVHAHLMKWLGGEGIRSRLAAGVGFEYLFSDEDHYAAMLSFAVCPWRGLVLGISPGVQWAEHEGDLESAYSTHLEAAYVFPLGAYDIGPMVDYSWTKDESHYMVGIHFGIHL